MFYSITGNVITSAASWIAVDCNGLGFKINTSANTLKKTGGNGSRVTLYTYMSVREDATELFGFYDEKELEYFKMLIGVNGVGPKAALSVLSELTCDRLALAVSGGDSKSITAAQGVGPKIAQRIVLELKGKLKVEITDDDGNEIDTVEVASNGGKREAVSALQFLGYSQSDAYKAVASLDGNLSVEDMIKEALKLLSGHNF